MRARIAVQPSTHGVDRVQRRKGVVCRGALGGGRGVRRDADPAAPERGGCPTLGGAAQGWGDPHPQTGIATTHLAVGESVARGDNARSIRSFQR